MDWVFGTLLTAALFVTLKYLTNFRFENSDDILMVKAFMGFEGGQPANFSLYLHTLLAWVLYALSLCAPNIPWFAWFQVGLLFISSTVIVKGLYQLTRISRCPLLFGTLASVLSLALFAAFVSCRINFTTTATLAGTAAIIQIMTVDFKAAGKATRMRALLLAFLLCIAAYCLRALVTLPALLFISTVLLWRLLPQAGEVRRVSIHWRAVLKAALLFAAILTALFAIRQAEIGLRGLRGYMEWNDANGALLDYSDFETNAEPAIESDSGLSASEIKLIQQWYFLSSDIDKQAVQTIADAYAQTEHDGWAVLTGFFSDNARYQFLAAVAVLLCMMCLFRLRRKAWCVPLLSLVSILVTLVLLYYLAAQGRLLYRAVDSVLLPCTALNLGFALDGLKNSSTQGSVRRVTMIFLSVLVAAAALGNLRLTCKAINAAPDIVSPQREADLEAYALANPELLIVRTPNLLRDTRLFPDVSDGTPGNIILWGDWLCRTPGWNNQLALFGFNAEHFTAADWLKGSIVFAALSPEDTEDLRTYIAEATGKAVASEEIGTYGTLCFYRFVIV
jgi:hypothetical protein